MLTHLVALNILSAPSGLSTIFPAFEDVDDDTITYWAARAARIVDDSWPEEDREHARYLLTAHYLTQQGLGTGAEAEAAAAGASGFTRLKSGSLEIERAAGNAGTYDSTSYGQQFAALLKAIRGGPRVTGTGTIAYGCGGFRSW